VQRRRHQSQRVRFLGRLSLVTLGLGVALGASACQKEDKAPLALKERSQAVTASGPAATAPSRATAPAAKPVELAPAKPRVLCAGQLDKAGRALPSSSLLSRATAAGASELPAELPAGHGAWTWINLWAAWCAPCKEEMPRLVTWQKKLSASGKHFQLFFVSLDDDERQLKTFLGAQPATGGMRSTYWLRDGAHREQWLKAAGIQDDPELPVQVLVDPEGKVRCVMHGAVVDSDFSQVEKIVSR
jgi:thiol-disulfide isomerase/thioredoxin